MKIRLFYSLLAILFFAQSSFAQEITMFPGFWGTTYYQDEDKISKGEVNSLMLADREANQLWQKSKSHETIAWVAVGAQIGLLVWQLNRSKNGESQTVPLIGVIGVGAVGIGFSFSSSSLRKKAILKYNHNQDTGALLNFGPTYNGLGMVYQF